MSLRDVIVPSDPNRHFEWGPHGAEGSGSGTTVVVDVLRFTTAVEAALSRFAVIYPFRWRDDSATKFARSCGALLADEADLEGPSLSPISLLNLKTRDIVVLPSPNGATCALLAAQFGAKVIAGCLRNASAIGQSLRDDGDVVTVIACGEQWPDGSLRPALEDLLGAGAILSHLGGRPSPEARAAVAVWRDAHAHVSEALTTTLSGRELIKRGLADDVRYASEVDVSDIVPVLRNGAFRASSTDELRP